MIALIFMILSALSISFAWNLPRDINYRKLGAQIITATAITSSTYFNPMSPSSAAPNSPVVVSIDKAVQDLEESHTRQETLNSMIEVFQSSSTKSTLTKAKYKKVVFINSSYYTNFNVLESY
jgi:hypothetical protein